MRTVVAYRKGKPEEAAVAPPQESPEPAAAKDDSPEVLEALRKVAEPHAHLSAVAKALGTDTAHVREVLTQAAVPITDMRMKGRGVSTGVKAADTFRAPLPAPPPRAPDLLLVLVRPTTTTPS